MLIHFCPRLLTPAGFDLPCELIDIRIKEFDLHLLGGRDVVARHPLPDKRYHVACRKSGCKAVNGLLVDVESTFRCSPWTPAGASTPKWSCATASSTWCSTPSTTR